MNFSVLILISSLILALWFDAGPLPPYREDCTVNVSHPMDKGVVLYDLVNGCVTHHVPHFLDLTTSPESMAISTNLTIIYHDKTLYNAKSGAKVRTINPLFNMSESVLPVLLLDGHFMAAVSDNHEKVCLINCQNGSGASHFLVHGIVVSIKAGLDDRTLYVSTKDGRLMVLVVILELSDPVRLLVSNLPSRSIQSV